MAYQHDGKDNSKSNIELQYNRFSEDWRHVNTIIWQIPSIAISIMTGIVFVAFHILEGWPRILLLSVGSLFMFVLTVVVVRQIVFANVRLFFLQYLEYKMGKMIFPTGLHEDQDEITKMEKDIPDGIVKFDPFVKDPVSMILNRQSSRRWLMYSMLILSILLAGAAVVSLLLYVKAFGYLF